MRAERAARRALPDGVRSERAEAVTERVGAHALASSLLAALLALPTIALAQDEDGSVEGQAGASGPPKVYVVAAPRLPAAVDEAARIGSSARAAIRDESSVQWRDADARFLGYTPTALSNLRRARQNLAAGRQAYLNVELDQAIQLLDQAVDQFDTAAAVLEDPSDLGDALMFLGAAQAFAGHGRDAERTFERVHIQLPDLRPDEQVFNPDVMQRFRAAAPRGANDARIAVDSDPPGALVFVDFVARGSTPTTVSDLPPGAHVVRVVRPGAAPFVRRVEARRGSTQSVDAELTDSEDAPGLADAVRRLPRSSTRRMEHGDPLTLVARSLELDKLVYLRVSPARNGEIVLEVLGYDVRSGVRVLSHDESVRVSALDQRVKEIVSNAVQAVVTAPVVDNGEDDDVVIGDGTQPPDEGSGGSVFGKWWFWTAVGVIAVGAVVAVVLATSGDEQPQGGGDGQVVLEF